MNFFYLFFLTVVTLISYKILIPIFKKKLFALPTSRGFHTIKKPTSGGIVFVFIFIIYSLVNKVYLPLLSLPMAIIGLLDDKLNIPGLQKYIFQLVTVLGITIYAAKFNNSFFSLYIEDHPYLYLILIFIGTAIINIINFMDGIDGLIAGSSIIIFLTIFYNNLDYIFAFIIPLLVFLYFNWQPSKLFMGDSGSLFIGSYLVSLIYTSSTHEGSYKIILLCFPLLIDSTVCLIRRLKNKQNIFKPHKLHLYQRLVSNNLSHSTVSLIYIFMTLLLSILYYFNNLKYMFICNICILLFGIYLDKKYAKEFNS